MSYKNIGKKLEIKIQEGIKEELTKFLLSLPNHTSVPISTLTHIYFLEGLFHFLLYFSWKEYLVSCNMYACPFLVAHNNFGAFMLSCISLHRRNSPVSNWLPIFSHVFKFFKQLYELVTYFMELCLHAIK